MVPRGSNGAGQAIMDGRALADLPGANQSALRNPVAALKAYQALRLPATSQVVLTNRQNPPDAIIREVYERSGDKPFARIEDLISREERLAITDNYKRVAGYTQAGLAAR